MQTSKYVHAIPAIVAGMEREREEADREQQPQEQEGELVLHRYRVEGGGMILSNVPLEEDQPPIIESEPPATTGKPTRKEPPFFVVVLLLFSLFLFLDSADTALTALFTPTATITLVPKSQTIMLHTSLPLGKLLAPITVSQSLTVPTTGHHHQKAQTATGYITFYNGLSTVQSVSVGTVFTGNDGVQIITTQAATIPEANPPQFGEITVTAQALSPGRAGNIAAYDISLALSNSLTAKNLTAFSDGQDERDFQIVTEDDITNAAATLKARVTASMTAALLSQLMPGEEMQPTPCSPSVTKSNNVGDEATRVTVSVSESCTAIAYDEKSLQQKALLLLTTQAAKTIGAGYTQYGEITLTVTKATTSSNTVDLTFTTMGMWVYHINEPHIQALVTGKPRLTALQVLSHLPGIKRASISGISDNQELPTDTTHIHLLIVIADF